MAIAKVMIRSQQGHPNLRVIDIREAQDWGVNDEGIRQVELETSQGRWINIELFDRTDKIFIENDAAKTCSKFQGGFEIHAVA